MTSINFPRLARWAVLCALVFLTLRLAIGCAMQPPVSVYGRPGDTSYQLYEDLQRDRYRQELKHQLRQPR